MENAEMLEQILLHQQKMLETINSRLDKMDSRFDGMDEKIEIIHNTVVRIENDHGDKLQALFDGYSQNYEMNKEIALKATGIESDLALMKMQNAFYKQAK